MPVSPEKFMEAVFNAFLSVPKIVTALDLGNTLRAKQNELTEKVLAGRAALLKDLPAAELKEATDEHAPDTVKPKAEKTPKPKAAAAAATAEEPAADEGFGEEEEVVTEADIRAFYTESTSDDKDPLSARTKTAFALVRREFCGETDGKPNSLKHLPKGQEGAFLKEFKRKVTALA